MLQVNVSSLKEGTTLWHKLEHQEYKIHNVYPGGTAFDVAPNHDNSLLQSVDNYQLENNFTVLVIAYGLIA